MNTLLILLAPLAYLPALIVGGAIGWWVRGRVPGRLDADRHNAAWFAGFRAGHREDEAFQDMVRQLESVSR